MVVIEIKNTNENILIARKIRDENKNQNEKMKIHFSEDASKIIIEAEKIYIPDKRLLTDEMTINGVLHSRGKGVEIIAKEKGKTVNLHLDAELVKEIDNIRSYVKSKTQHDVLLELFKKGIEQYKKEQEE
ncbi:hypothetical protein [Aneurinibacillus terranovensis]|uniref:hypothetical protein n=1 Tax=Aneurinibacillus terranovensis TaxID=278991 RepID=UPI00041F8E03|nr:hypothetical protein [Aneurinibacillus terranovensis]